MSYTINRYSGTQITVVADGTIDSTLDIKLIGKNYAGYGEVQNENFVALLENFANTTQPPNPLSGQVWFDSANSKLKFFDGNKFRTTGGAETGATRPTGLTLGDFWFDTVNNQLNAWNGTDYTLVGPQVAAGYSTTQVRSRTVRALNGSTSPIVEALVGNTTLFVVSNVDVSPIDGGIETGLTASGFTKLHRGITLASTNNDSQPGQTTDGTRFWGTATNSDRLGGFASADFVKSNSAGFTNLVNFADVGYTVGSPVARLHVFNESNLNPVIENQSNNQIQFRTRNSITEAVYKPMTLLGPDILPGQDATSNLGSATVKFVTIYGANFTGTSAKADTLLLGSNYVSASTASSASTIVARDSSQNIAANLFSGTATAAQYADLAEKYLADKDYEVGTVVSVGGEKEVTACQTNDRAVGVVSANPAFMMNKDLVGGTYIALKGRVPVKVFGSVAKGDRMRAFKDGSAISIVSGYSNSDVVFAIALESSDDAGIKLIECIVL
jgi:hypothetical protein